MEKLGTRKEDLLAELQATYNDKKEKLSRLVKTAAPAENISATDAELDALKARIDEIQAQ